jgi:hypothetical protein
MKATRWIRPPSDAINQRDEICPAPGAIDQRDEMDWPAPAATG